MRWIVAVILILLPSVVRVRANAAAAILDGARCRASACAPQKVCVEVAVPRHPGQPERAPEQERGAFASPPRSGMVAGESESVGLSGGALHIPSMSLRLPTLQLPCLTRYRREAHMVMDTTEAPWVNERRREYSIDAGPEIAGVLERAQIAPERAPEAAKAPEKQSCAPQPPPPCDAELMRLRQREQMLEQRIWQLEQCLRQMPPPANTQLRVLPPASPPPVTRPAPAAAPQQPPVRCQDGSCPPGANPQQTAPRPGPVHYGKPPMEEIPMPLQDSSMSAPAGQPQPLPRSPFQNGMAAYQPKGDARAYIDPRIAQLSATVARLEQKLHAFEQVQAPAVQHSAYYHPIIDLPISPSPVEELPRVE